jgi:hypothetical protein
MVWAGETRGVPVSASATTSAFADSDIELLEAFASLASLALETPACRSSRQARVQRSFYRIASLLGEPLSLAETYDTAAQAAADVARRDSLPSSSTRREELVVAGGCIARRRPDARHSPCSRRAAAADRCSASRIADDGRFDDQWRAGPFASLLLIPVPGDGGLVIVFFGVEHTFSRDDLELAQQVTGKPLVRWTAAACSMRSGRPAPFAAACADQAVCSPRARPGAVLEAIVAEAVLLLDVETAALAALEGDELVVTAAAGKGADVALGARSPSTDWVAGDVIHSEPVAYADASAKRARRLRRAAPGSVTAGISAFRSARPRSSSACSPSTQRNRAVARRRCRRLSHSRRTPPLRCRTPSCTRASRSSEQSVAISRISRTDRRGHREGNVVLWNRAAEEILSVPEIGGVGRTPAQCCNAIESESGGTNRLVAIKGDEDVWLSLSEAVMRDPTGAVAGFAFRDISAEHAVEQMKSDFVSTVSVERARR